MFNLKGNAAFGTGAGGEHGNAGGIALRLAEDGADVVATDIEMKPCADADGGPAGTAGGNRGSRAPFPGLALQHNRWRCCRWRHATDNRDLQTN